MLISNSNHKFQNVYAFFIHISVSIGMRDYLDPTHFLSTHMNIPQRLLILKFTFTLIMEFCYRSNLPFRLSYINCIAIPNPYVSSSRSLLNKFEYSFKNKFICISRGLLTYFMKSKLKLNLFWIRFNCNLVNMYLLDFGRPPAKFWKVHKWSIWWCRDCIFRDNI